MRIRTVKPEFWRSDDITALTREDRLLFIGLWSYVDDNGVGVDDYRAIAADLFALEDDQKDVRDFVRDGLATLSRALLIDRYEVAGRNYIHIRTWKKHQRVDRPNKPRYPLPDETPEPPTSGDAKPSRDPRDTFATVSPSGTEEQRNRGTTTSRSAKAKRTTEQLDEGFLTFYAAYPKKKARGQALEAWRKAMRHDVDPERIMAGLRTQLAAWRVEQREPQYVPYPASWLNAQSYDDDFGPVALTLVPDNATPDDGYAALLDRADAREAARLIGASWADPAKPPSDPTPQQQWVREKRREFIRAHADRLRAAIAERKTG